MDIVFLILGLISVFLTKKQMSKEFGRFVHRLGGDHKAFINFWSAIFLPGTILHEVSHFLVAAMCGLRTGKVEVLPEFIDEAINEDKVHLGYVQVSKMNPLQGFLVGTAPFITGLGLLVWLSTLTPNALQIYIFFTVANSFFPSWEDIKHTLPLIVLLILVSIATWYFGFSFTVHINSKVLTILNILSRTLFLSAILNCIIIVPFYIINHIGIRAKS